MSIKTDSSTYLLSRGILFIETEQCRFARHSCKHQTGTLRAFDDHTLYIVDFSPMLPVRFCL